MTFVSRISDELTARVSAILFALSPFVLFMSGSEMNLHGHTGVHPDRTRCVGAMDDGHGDQARIVGVVGDWCESRCRGDDSSFRCRGRRVDDGSLSTRRHQGEAMVAAIADRAVHRRPDSSGAVVRNQRGDGWTTIRVRVRRVERPGASPWLPHDATRLRAYAEARVVHDFGVSDEARRRPVRLGGASDARCS